MDDHIREDTARAPTEAVDADGPADPTPPPATDDPAPGTGRRPFQGLVREVVEDVVGAIGDELSALATDPTTAITVRNGRPVGAVGPDRLWSFEFDGALPVPPETPARISVPERDPVRATILAVGDLDLVVGVRDELGESVAHAKLSVEPWFIYDALRGRIEDMLEGGGDVALLEALLDLTDEPVDRTSGGVSHLALGLGADQEAAVRNASAGGLRFVWGPPGTGKTSTLATTVRLLATHPEPSSPDADHRAAAALIAGAPQRVLVLAHANAAVDVAMARVADELVGTDVLESGRVLRIGTPQLDVARDRPEILPDRIIARQQPELATQQEALDAERRSLSRRLKAARSDAELDELTARLEEVRAAQAENEKRLREARAKLVRDATVIGATLSKLVIDDQLWSWPAATVIVDEASMAGLPFVVALAMRGASTLACFGDFRQLPPIAISERERAQQWFGRDVFTLSGVVSRVEAGDEDPRLAILRTQYRMGEDIASLVGRLAYFDLLRTDADAARRATPIAALPPGPQHEVVVVDTGSLGAACQQDADPRSYSRFNLLTAALARTLARRLRQAGDVAVGIVTPYRAQAQLLEAVTRSDERTTAATTHRFQGSERAAIVVDLVDTAPATGPSRLTGTDPDLSLRLLNVAVSRAQGKVVILADLDFVAERHGQRSPVRRLIEMALDDGAPRIDATDLLETDELVTWSCDWPEAVRRALEEAGSPGAVDISVPDESFAGPWLRSAVDDLCGRGVRVTVRAPAPVAIDLEETEADLRLRTLGPAPLAFVGDDVLVTGSSRLDGPVIRVDSAALVSAAQRLLLPVV